MHVKVWALTALLAIGAGTGALRASTNVFENPALFRRHQALAGELRLSLRRHDAIEMDRICRAGVALLPESPTWHYNLACALALQNHPSEALAELDRSVELGFSDADAIAHDTDLTNLRSLPAFQTIVAKARMSPGMRIRAQPVVGGVAWVTASNTLWDFDAGYFRSFFAAPTNAPSPAELAARWNGPEAPTIRPWMASNAAAGNAGDFYDNRDDGHSRLDPAPFAGMAAIQYDADARSHGAHYGLASFLFNGVVIGNSSVAQTSGPYWRSVPRAALVDGLATGFLFVQYLNNHLYVYPCHHDHDAAGLGDLYPVNQPYVVISQGSSGTDQPFLAAVAATLAALQPATKRYLATHGVLMPTVQMLLRASQKTLVKPEDYLTGRAHPTVFDAANLDVPRMLRMAHELTTNDVPPIVALRTLDDHLATPGVDFFDLAASDALYDTPCLIGRVMRGMAFRRTMQVGAQLSGVPSDGWHLHWVVLRGLPGKVILMPLTPDQSRTEISVAYHGGHFPVEPGQPLQSSRVDIGVIASRGRLFTAPAFVSFVHLDNELRTYADDGRILSVDYAAAATNRYVDPVLSLAKHWRDDYTYDADNQPTGWTRRRGDVVERFTPRGERIEATDKLGRATVTRTVSYIQRSTQDGRSTPDLVQVDGDTRVAYRYASEADFTGEVFSREHAAP